jgi:type IV secretory pathway TraG/TraD family ATPase VirD4
MSQLNGGSFVATKLFLSQVPSTSSLPPSLQFGIQRLQKTAMSPMGLFIGAIVIFLVIARLFNGGADKAGKVATGYWGGPKEKSKAAKKAKNQIKSPKRNSVALYVGTPKFMSDRLEQDWIQKGLVKPKSQWEKVTGSGMSSDSTLYLPDVQRGTSVAGAAGSGKTFSVIDPLIRSALDQGFPMVLYDFKYPAQTKRAAAYAMKRGYNVRVFAPGFPESETCNPLDFIRDEEDAVAAGQLAQVINKNFDSGGKGGDKFFEEAGDSLVEGILLVTKAVGRMAGPQYCDLMMSQAILSMPQMVDRLEYASRDGRLSVWASRPLSQVFGVKDSEKTVAGIVGTAQRLFMRFMKRDFIGSFCGRTTLPLDLDGKQLLVFGLDRNNRDIVGPLLAAIIHMVVSRNVSRTIPRKDPLVVALDELPTLRLPQLVRWLNEAREDGFCGILGYQNLSQLEETYSKEVARAIFGGTANKIIFNPQDSDSAKLFADYLGEFEVQFKSKSKSTSPKSGASQSTSDHHQKRHLLEPAQFLKLATGRAVIVNPAYERAKEAYVPLLQNIKVPKSDIDQMSWSEQKWDSIYKKLLVRNNETVTDAERTRQFEERRALAEKLFPLPQDTQPQSVPVAPSDSDLVGAGASSGISDNF